MQTEKVKKKSGVGGLGKFVHKMWAKNKKKKLSIPPWVLDFITVACLAVQE